MIKVQLMLLGDLFLDNVLRCMIVICVMNLDQVEIKRTIPKGSTQASDFKTKKIFVGGIPTTVTEGLMFELFNIRLKCYCCCN